MRQRVALCDQKDPSDLGFSAPNAVMRLPLCPRKRTLRDAVGMSASCHEQTHAPQQSQTFYLMFTVILSETTGGLNG
jgi:hypothetical protein